MDKHMIAAWDRLDPKNATGRMVYLSNASVGMLNPGGGCGQGCARIVLLQGCSAPPLSPESACKRQANDFYLGMALHSHWRSTLAMAVELENPPLQQRPYVVVERVNVEEHVF